MFKAAQASVLILFLACSAQAGNVPHDSSPTPPPPAPAVAETTYVTYETPTYDAAASLTQAAMDLLAVMPSLL